MTPARAALALYPPSWRARYGDEVLAYLDESGGGPAAVASLNLWARQFAGYHDGTLSGIYLALVVTAATVTTVSAARGTRAALAHP